MDDSGLDGLLNQPGEYIGARRVRRPHRAAGALALEWWDGAVWVRAGEAADSDGVRGWLSGTPHGTHPWQPGTGRRRKTSGPPAPGRQTA
ncbi:hypothetical protein GCM10023205_25370 [Yinghuangia aomiensis]|uniref:Uncharacterized protein n=1 Tax=Yinghuangia aomiensis TaxID=676205 RepID=A0ABP9H2Y3_9ACTN